MSLYTTVIITSLGRIHMQSMFGSHEGWAVGSWIMATMSLSEHSSGDVHIMQDELNFAEELQAHSIRMGLVLVCACSVLCIEGRGLSGPGTCWQTLGQMTELFCCSGVGISSRATLLLQSSLGKPWGLQGPPS